MGSATNWTVTCAKCGLRWDRTGHLTHYERQSVESRPCPGCGAYTLTCREARAAGPHRSSRRRVA